MTTLKSINKAIEEGNEDLERLNNTLLNGLSYKRKIVLMI